MFALFYRSRRNISTPISVTINGKPEAVMSIPQLLCRKINRTILWRQREPTGFFYRGQWYLRHCKSKYDTFIIAEGERK